ncbi:MAG: cytochrome d ubiquinol oxidase subunit II [Caulobacteraceae bacterium]
MTLFWVGALALVILLYVLLDGFDLGVGILFSFAQDQRHRRQMLAAISPVWDGNETWLVLAITILFGAFSKVYSALLAAFYLPLTFMLGALILRGVAFEFRNKTIRMRWLWDMAFAGGSTAAAFLQGVTVGQLVLGLPLVDGAYAGAPLEWLNPFALLCGLGLCLGYALLGATWLIRKCEGEVRERAYQALPLLLGTALVVLAAVFILALTQHVAIMQRWLQRPWLAVFPLMGLGAFSYLLRALQRRRTDWRPFWMVALIFLSAFGTLAASFWPYMIPFSMTIDQAASPAASQSFLFWGAGLVVLPLTLIYTVIAYRVFGGKVILENEEY